MFVEWINNYSSEHCMVQINKQNAFVRTVSGVNSGGGPFHWQNDKP